MAVTDAQVKVDLENGDRYVVSDEDAYEYFCETRGLEPYDGNGDPNQDADRAWAELSDDAANEFIFPRVREDLRDV